MMLGELCVQMGCVAVGDGVYTHVRACAKFRRGERARECLWDAVGIGWDSSNVLIRHLVLRSNLGFSVCDGCMIDTFDGGGKRRRRQRRRFLRFVVYNSTTTVLPAN